MAGYRGIHGRWRYLRGPFAANEGRFGLQAWSIRIGEPSKQSKPPQINVRAVKTKLGQRLRRLCLQEQNPVWIDTEDPAVLILDLNDRVGL